MKRALTLLLFLSTCYGLMSQTSRKEVFRMASQAGDYSYEELIRFAGDQLNDPESLALFFYYWISLNIEYDYTVTPEEISHSKKAAGSVQVPAVFKSRKTTCMGFTNLYRSFLNDFDISHRVVLGYSKSPVNILQKIPPQKDHAWSAIKLDDQWYLVEITWANQFINEPLTRDFYFKADPQEMMRQHFPADEKWQLLEDKRTFAEFLEIPLIDPWYICRAIPEEQLIQIEKNENDEWTIICARTPKWKLRLKNVDQENQDLMNLKYRIKRSRNTIQFTLKNYDGKSTLRLDARRTGAYSTELTAPGLAYLVNIDQH